MNFSVGHFQTLKLELKILHLFCHNSLRESIQVPLLTLKKILSRPITKFYNSDDATLIAVELWLTKTRSTSFYKKHNLL